MTVRQRVLAAYGHCCAWCGRSDRALEIDHVHGGQGAGNAHRRLIKEPLERWLWRQYQRLGHWPPGYQLLCVTSAQTGCHDRKSGRRLQRMPAKSGNTSLHISVPADLAARLDVLAKAPGESKSTVVETALRHLLEGGASQTLLDGVHQALAEQKAVLTQVEQTLGALAHRLARLETLVTAQGKTHDTLIDASNLLYDLVDGHHGKVLPAGSRLKQFFGQK